jgi:hypothetical protein
MFRKMLIGVLGILILDGIMEASTSDEQASVLQKMRGQFAKQMEFFAACRNELDAISSRNGSRVEIANHKTFLSLAEKLCKYLSKGCTGEELLSNLKETEELIEKSAPQQRTDDFADVAELEVDESALGSDESEIELNGQNCEEDPLSQEQLDALFKYDCLNRRLVAEVHSILERAKSSDDIEKSKTSLSTLVNNMRETAYYKSNKKNAANGLFRTIEYLQFKEQTKVLYTNLFANIKQDYDEG